MGRLASQVRLTLLLRVRTRYNADEADRNRQWLVQATEGHWRTVWAVFNALQIFAPGDPSASWQVTEPVRFTGGTAPRVGNPDETWGDTTLSLEVEFLADLDQARQ